MVPALSRLLSEPDRYRSAYLRVVPIVLLVALPGVAMATALADTIIPMAFGSQWRGSSGIFRALGFAGLLQPLNNPAGWLFISQGRSTEFMRWGIFAAVTSVTAFVIGLPFGALGVATAYAVSEYLRTPFLWTYIGSKGPLSTRHILRAAAPFVLGGHFSLAGVWALGQCLPIDSMLAVAGCCALSYGLTVGIAVLFPSGRETLKSALSLIPLGLLRSTFRASKFP
jgi:PST family polysaccharide transporter